MAKIKNTSGEPLIVPAMGGRMVLAGQVVDVAESAVYGFTCQADTWSPADDEAETAHEQAEERYRPVVEPDPEPAIALEPPAGNASREVWAEWAVAAGRATEDDVATLGRDEIRKTYGPQED